LLGQRDIKMEDRRSDDRTRIAKAGSLFFGGQTGVHSCDVNLTDLTEGGAGIYKQGLAALPLNFELSFDDLRRKCRLVWRKGNFFGVAFENLGIPGDSETPVAEPDLIMPEPAFSILNDPPQNICLGDADMLSEWMSRGTDRKNEGRADLRFTFGVAVALALPVLIGMSAYIATAAILKVN
jgi:hypothetical protein